MRSGVRKITYDNSSDTYLIITDDAERCGYPLYANLLLNKRIYDQMKIKMQEWTHVIHQRSGCFDIIDKLENIDVSEKKSQGTLATIT